MSDAIRQWAASVSFDAVIAFSSSMAQYIPLARAKRSVLDLCDLDSKKWLEYADSAGPAGRVLFRREASRLSLLEVQWIDRCDAGVLITEAEARALNGSTVRSKIHVIGNGVDIPTPGVTGNDSVHRHTVGFVGQMDYRPNVDAVCWFVRNCWESIRRRWPEAVFQIVGRQPVRQVKRLANIPGVEVVGEVEHVAEYVEAFDVSVAPLRIARGLQNKVLEAMSALRPVVLTPAAAAGIDAVDGTHWLIADSATDMVEQVSRLLGDPAGRIRIGTAAQAFVAQHHRWQDQLAKFDQLVQGSM